MDTTVKEVYDFNMWLTDLLHRRFPELLPYLRLSLKEGAYVEVPTFKLTADLSKSMVILTLASSQENKDMVLHYDFKSGGYIIHKQNQICVRNHIKFTDIAYKKPCYLVVDASFYEEIYVSLNEIKYLYRCKLGKSEDWSLVSFGRHMHISIQSGKEAVCEPVLYLYCFGSDTATCMDDYFKSLMPVILTKNSYYTLLANDLYFANK